MKSYCRYLLPSLALISLAPQAWAEKEIIIRRLNVDAPHHLVINKEGGGGERESVTYLGLETAPVGRTLGAQLGLGREVGLVVTQVMPKSPAAELLREDDVLLKLDDQWLVNMQQLGVLIRARKEGEEVKLTLVRGGKETIIKVKLGTREVPKQSQALLLRNGGPGDMNWSRSLLPEGLAGLEQLRELPGMEPEHAREVLRMIGRERGNVMSGPGVRIIARAGKGSTMVDLPKSNISYSDDAGSIEIKVDDGKRRLTVTDTKGVVAFDGPITTEEERKKLPAEVSQRLAKLENDTISFEVGDDFKPDVVPLPPPPTKTKIRHGLKSAPLPVPALEPRPF